MDFLITYEHKAREIESVLLLKILLERKGYSVMLYPWYAETREMQEIVKKDPPKVFVISATYNEDNFRTFVTRVVGFANKIINLRWEQVFTVEDENIPIDINLPAFYPSGIVREVVHVCWGVEEQRQLIARGVKKEKAALIGHIGMDYLRPEFRNLMPSKEEISELYHLDLSKKWALFISSFTVYEYDKRTEQEHRTLTGNLGVEEVFIKACIESRKLLLEWFEHVLEEVNDTIIIYRPHPNEAKTPKELSALEAKYDNFRVISDLSVKQWINVSDIIYNWFSSSFADIAFLGKKSFLLRPYYISPEYDYKALSIQPQISTYDDFYKSLNKSFYSDSEKNLEFNSIIHEYYDNDMYGEPAYIKAVNLFEKVYNTSELDIHYPIRFIIESKVLFLNRKILSYINWFLVKAPILKKTILKDWYKKRIENEKFAKERLAKGFVRNVATQQEIDEMTEKLKKILFNG